MAILTLLDLRTAIKDRLERSALPDSLVDEFISVAAGYIHHGIGSVEPLRISAMEAEVDLVLTARTIALPAGHLQTKRLYIDGTPVQLLDYVSPERMRSVWAGSASGKPKLFSVEGREFLFGPTGNFTVKCQYVKAFNPLVDDLDTNWLLETQPGAYLYGALIEAATWMGDAGLESRMAAKFGSIMLALSRSDMQMRHSGSDWVVRPEGGSP